MVTNACKIVETDANRGESVVKKGYTAGLAIPDPRLKMDRSHVQKPYRGPQGRKAGTRAVYNPKKCQSMLVTPGRSVHSTISNYANPAKSRIHSLTINVLRTKLRRNI